MIKIFNSLFVTMFGIGKLKPIPGTFGSLATVIILYFCFHKLEISSNLIFLGLLVIFIYSFTAVTSHTKDKNNTQSYNGITPLSPVQASHHRRQSRHQWAGNMQCTVYFSRGDRIHHSTTPIIDQ